LRHDRDHPIRVALGDEAAVDADAFGEAELDGDERRRLHRAYERARDDGVELHAGLLQRRADRACFANAVRGEGALPVVGRVVDGTRVADEIELTHAVHDTPKISACAGPTCRRPR
jgi:hypothetical protein